MSFRPATVRRAGLAVGLLVAGLAAALLGWEDLAADEAPAASPAAPAGPAAEEIPSEPPAPPVEPVAAPAPLPVADADWEIFGPPAATPETVAEAGPADADLHLRGFSEMAGEPRRAVIWAERPDGGGELLLLAAGETAGGVTVVELGEDRVTVEAPDRVVLTRAAAPAEGGAALSRAARTRRPRRSTPAPSARPTPAARRSPAVPQAAARDRRPAPPAAPGRGLRAFDPSTIPPPPPPPPPGLRDSLPIDDDD